MISKSRSNTPPTHLGLAVVLQRHGDDVDADDEGDDQIQVVAGAQGMDGQSGWTVGGIVGQLLCLWGQRRAEVRWRTVEDKPTTSSDDELTQEFLFFLSHRSILPSPNSEPPRRFMHYPIYFN